MRNKTNVQAALAALIQSAFGRPPRRTTSELGRWRDRQRPEDRRKALEAAAERRAKKNARRAQAIQKSRAGQ